ncbi:AMP-dependent synthetase [Alteromonas aestuariivivens]|uniref:AMP-dependent synthetase n=1 Tax=Alteromonas aestuariivivens TaxID=1938339 RepID=A0A3D8M4I9_9ALTE|nr:AMP-binding protein [Alteromonas aestuariivivens]RDV24465.1 AMP-dependent synthetase [Alteromonas aestuariivivens]
MPSDLTNPMTNGQTVTPLSMLYYWEATRGDEPYLFQPVNGELQKYTWSEVGNLARRVARRLQQMALPEGSRISILSKNCVEWFVVDLGIMMAGHVSVPIFSTAGAQTIDYVLRHSDAKLVFVGKLDEPEKQIAAIDPAIPTVAFPYPGTTADQYWPEFIDCPPIETSPLPDLAKIMTIIYTSGSTGQPKGVVHTYETICWAAQHALESLTLSQQDRMVSYLPLAHITERVLVELASFYAGEQIYFVESLETFQRDVQACEPTLFVSVPRLWTKFQMGILSKIPQNKLDILLRIPLVKNLIAKKVRKGLGLDRTRLWASGSAPLAPAVIRWFARLGICISEGWGMTENSAYGSAVVPFRLDKIGTIGRPYKGVSIRISDEGEIQVKSPCNMTEYYLDPEKTAEVFTEDGYLKTGDKGVIDEEGYIRITGRLKDIFKTAKGKYVTPSPIEAKLMQNSLIEQVCVTGSNLPQPIALLVLSEDSRSMGRDALGRSLNKTLNEVNLTLESHQKLDRVIVLDEPWTVENDLLTPTLKVKRHILEARFNDIIQADYSDKLVWL